MIASSVSNAASCATLKRGIQDKRRPYNEGRVQNHVQTIDVIKRQKAKYVVVSGKHHRIRSQKLIHIRDQIVVRKHDAFGEAGGAAGKVMRPAAFQRTDRAWAAKRLRAATEWKTFPRRFPVAACNKRAAEVRQVREADAVDIRSVGDQKRRAGICKLMAYLRSR